MLGLVVLLGIGLRVLLTRRPCRLLRAFFGYVRDLLICAFALLFIALALIAVGHGGLTR